jgi:hypothetical protein
VSAPSTFAATAPPGDAGLGWVGARTRRLALGSLALVFLAGGGLGWGLGSRFGRQGLSGGHGPGRGGGRGPRAGMLLDAGPIARYQLTPAQRTRVDSILGARRSEIDAFWRGPGQQLRAILDATGADVRAVLTPAQQATFDSARAAHGRRARGRFGPGGPPFGGPAPGGAPGAR